MIELKYKMIIEWSEEDRSSLLKNILCKLVTGH